MITTIAIAVVGVLSIAAVLLRAYLWHRHWGLELGGVPVHYACMRTPELDHELRAANEVITEFLESRFSKPLDLPIRYAVEVLTSGASDMPPPGAKVSDHHPLGGTQRSARMFPWTPKYAIAVIVNRRASAHLAHEVLRHVTSIEIYGSLDLEHRNAPLEAAENQVKSLIRMRLGQ